MLIYRPTGKGAIQTSDGSPANFGKPLVAEFKLRHSRSPVRVKKMRFGRFSCGEVGITAAFMRLALMPIQSWCSSRSVDFGVEA